MAKQNFDNYLNIRGHAQLSEPFLIGERVLLIENTGQVIARGVLNEIKLPLYGSEATICIDGTSYSIRNPKYSYRLDDDTQPRLIKESWIGDYDESVISAQFRIFSHIWSLARNDICKEKMEAVKTNMNSLQIAMDDIISSLSEEELSRIRSIGRSICGINQMSRDDIDRDLYRSLAYSAYKAQAE